MDYVRTCAVCQCSVFEHVNVTDTKITPLGRTMGQDHQKCKETLLAVNVIDFEFFGFNSQDMWRETTLIIIFLLLSKALFQAY